MGRSRNSRMGHHCCSKQKVKRGLWSPEEDEKLVNYITTHGHGSWSSVPKLAGTNVLSIFLIFSFLFYLVITTMEEGRGDLNLDFPYEGEKIMPLRVTRLLVVQMFFLVYQTHDSCSSQYFSKGFNFSILNYGLCRLAEVWKELQIKMDKLFETRSQKGFVFLTRRENHH